MTSDGTAMAHVDGSRRPTARVGSRSTQGGRDSLIDDLIVSGPIAVVDDDSSVRRSTTLLLQSFGLGAVTFDSAEAFLGFEGLDAISCLIVDVQMPGTSGLQLQARLNEDGKKISIVFITAYEDAAARQQAMSAGAVAFLAKPFSDDQLLRAIRLALEGRNELGGCS